MTLFTQIQVFIGTVALSMLYLFFYSVYNRLFYHWQGKIIRYLLDIIFFSACAYFYFLFLVHYAKGQLNLHYLLAGLLGLFFYQKFYAKWINLWLEKKMKWLDIKIGQPLSRTNSKFRAIIKKKKRGMVHERRKKETSHH